MILRNIFRVILVILSPLLALIAAALMVLMFIGIVTFQFNIMALAVLFIFAVFGHIIAHIMSDSFDGSYEKTGN